MTYAELAAAAMTVDQLRKRAAAILALPVAPNEGAYHILARLRHCGPEGEALVREWYCSHSL